MSRWRFPLTLAAGIACALPVFAETPAPAPHDPVILMRQHMLDADINAFSFRSMDKFFETRTVAHGGKAGTLPVAKGWNPPSLDWGGERLSYEDWARRTYTNAVLVIHDGKIVFEDYRNDRPGSFHLLFDGEVDRIAAHRHRSCRGPHRLSR
jgi:hypothetical protein